MNSVDTSNPKAAGSSQKLKLFMRGRAMSGAPIISGIIQLARPTKAGMMAPKTITRPCMVVIWLKNSGSTICRPGWKSSARITIAKKPPSRNMAKLNHMYMLPMSLWLVVNNHRRMPVAGPCAIAYLLLILQLDDIDRLYLVAHVVAKGIALECHHCGNVNR